MAEKREAHGHEVLTPIFDKSCDPSFEEIEKLIVAFQTLVPPHTKLSSGFSAFHTLVHFGRLKEIVICIKQGVQIAHKTSPDCQYSFASALHIAAAKNHEVITKLLIETG